MFQHHVVKKGTVFGATLLVSGTCIGGGMLALPVITAASGFFPSFVLMAACWIFMTLTGLLLIEANLWMEEGAHITTMASRLLGRFGKFVAVMLYLFMGYASLIAYNAGGGEIVAIAVAKLIGFPLSRIESCLLFTLIFGTMIYLGTRVIGRINAILVVGMIAAYIALVVVGIDEIRLDYLQHMNWGHSFTAMPIIFTTFSYQLIVPSLTPYLHRDSRMIRKSIILGTSIPFVIYLIWQCLTLGQIPVEGEYGLAQTLERGSSVIESLRNLTDSSLLGIFADYFAFFTLVTSYLGIALGLFDFLSDALKIKKQGSNYWILGSLIVVPALFFTILYPNAFIFFLELSGGFGDALLSGLIPVMMVWIGRYSKRIEGPYQVLGGKGVLASLFAMAIFVLLVQVYNLL